MTGFIIDVDAVMRCSDNLNSLSSNYSKTSGDVLDVQNTLVMDGQYKEQMIRSMNDIETAILRDAVKTKNLAQALVYICDRYKATEKSLCGELSVIERALYVLDTSMYDVFDKLGLSEQFINLKYDYDNFDEARTQEKMMDLYLQYQCLALMEDPKYDETAWNNASYAEREQMIRDFIADVNVILGTNVALNVIFDDGEGNTKNNGYFSWDDREIYINPARLKSGDRAVFNTCIHESRHCYQRCVVEHPESYIVSQETVERWRDNFKKGNYIDGGEPGYYEQPIEWDAFNFANQVDRVKGKTPVYSGSWD